MAPVMRVANANDITGGLSRPSKMPCYSYCLPASRCIIGSKLRGREGTVCSKCYALKGRGVFPNVQAAHERRHRAVMRALESRSTRLQWIDAMTFLIARQGSVFRWHSSGDVQSVDHCRMICDVSRATPGVRHWIPSKERGMWSVAADAAPANLTVRISAARIDALPVARPFETYMPVSTVHSEPSRVPRGAVVCPAPEQGNACGDCRVCWDPGVRVVSYALH